VGFSCDCREDVLLKGTLSETVEQLGNGRTDETLTEPLTITFELKPYKSNCTV